jgi:hypothetical protein
VEMSRGNRTMPDVLLAPMIQLPIVEVECPVDATLPPSAVGLLRFAEALISRQPAELPTAIKSLYFRSVIFRVFHHCFWFRDAQIVCSTRTGIPGKSLVGPGELRVARGETQEVESHCERLAIEALVGSSFSCLRDSEEAAQVRSPSVLK